MLNELEMKEKTNTIYEAIQHMKIFNREDLANIVEILKGVKEHREKIIDYWKSPKNTAKKTYDEIRLKEKEMLDICDEIENKLKNEILIYKETQEQNAKELTNEAEKYRKQEIEKLLSESIEAQINGDEESAKCKLRQAEIIKNLEKHTEKIFQKSDGITIQKRWQVRIVDNQSVPAFFNGAEIREINKNKLLELRKFNPNAKIPGVEFYQSETIVIKK